MSLHSALLVAAIGLAWTLPASAAGCQYDMQCKGDRICQQGVCMAPPTDGDDTTAASAPVSKPLPPIKLSPQQPPSVPQQAATVQQQPVSAPHQAPSSLPRSCCTVAGKLRLAPPQSGDAPLEIGDSCQGITNSGKPVPGTACN